MKKQDLIITRVMDAPVAAVWQAWTDSAVLQQWWGPTGFSCPVAELDVRAGGTSLVAMEAPEFGRHYSTWHYQTVVPHQQLAFIHNLADAHGNKIDPAAAGMPPDFPVDQLQTVTFEALTAQQTRLTVVEYGWTAGQMMDYSKMGMEQCLDKLAETLAAK